MTTSSAVHSNAFNFMSFMNNSVDPRTGQYTLSIDLPELKANALIGPNVPIKLDFNPLNLLDSGYGLGWNLRLSEFNPVNNMLSLHTGESYKVTGDGKEPSIKEKKLDTFRFFDEGNGVWRIVHKSGLVEVLKELGSGSRRIALPSEILAPSGHAVKLSYAVFETTHRLASIADASGELLRLVRDSSEVRLLLPPFDDKPLSRFVMKLSGGRVTEIVLPVPELACWRLTYETVRGISCVKTVGTPLGGSETLEYLDGGHAYPGSTGRPNLPRVTRHTIVPGPDLTAQETTYAYTTENFIGNGSSINWQDDGLDQLYKVDYTYDYGSVASHVLDGKVVRTVKYTFNRFHLMTEEETRQGRCVKTVSTTYHALDTDFDNQPANFQLPRSVQTRWSIDGEPNRHRTETQISEFDLDGNPTLEVRPDGVSTSSTWYKAAGEDGCPEDPDGFVRHLKEQVVTPAPDGACDAPVLRTQYRYVRLEPLASVQKNAWLALESETLSEGATVLKETRHEHFDKPDDASLHGRIASDSETYNGQPTFTDYHYQVLATEGVLQTTETLTGFDKTSKTLVLQHALLIGEPVQTHDDDDVVIRYSYDTLRRVTSETVAPDSDYEATRHYAYTLARLDGQRAIQVMTDVKNVQTRTTVDGLNRPILEERQDVDGADGADIAWRTTYTARFDGLGQKVEECEFDWLLEEQLPLVHHFTYDDWGQQRSDTGPDKVVVFEEHDPIGSTEWIGPISRAWRESIDGEQVSGQTVTRVNLFGKPARVERFDTEAEPVRISLHEYFYDGLGRTRREVDGRDQTTLYHYDAFDRLVENVLPGLAVVRRRFVTHSDEDLPTHISVDEVELGQQDFDGLSRMTRSVTGGRERLFTYQPGRMQPATVTTPAGAVIAYEYLPQLGDEPMRRELSPEVAADYVYDKKNARLLSCTEQGQSLVREYFSTGELKSETRSEDGQEYAMHYAYSLRGRLLSYTDVFGQAQTYEYDTAGRLTCTVLGSTTSTFHYDGLGRLEWIKTNDNGEQLHVQIGYDDFSRETSRCFDFGDLTQQLTQEWNAVDRLTKRIHHEGETLVREERYGYDERNRLTDYQCDGSPPLDAYGQAVQAQLFRFDGMDNITRVMTVFPGGQNRADYHYDNPADPTQLTHVINSDEPYPPRIDLEYDEDGNLVRDEQARQLNYDALGRLLGVGDGNGALSGSYRYDPLDRLASLSGAQGAEQRFYREEELANLLQGEQGSTFMRGAGNLLAEHQAGDISLLLGCDQKNSVLSEHVAGEGITDMAYTAHGHRSTRVQARLAFNGELDEEAGGQLLGKATGSTDLS